MSIWLISALSQLSIVMANAQDEDGGGWLLVAGPAAGLALYLALFRYYRDTDKSHQFERETCVTAKPITGSDAKVDEVRGTKARSIQGNNVRSFRQRVQRVE